MSTSSRPICRHHWRGEVFIFWLSLVNSIIVFQRYNNIQSKRRNKGKQGICWVEIELNIDTFQVTLKRRDISPTQLPQFGDKFRDHWSSCSRSQLWYEHRLFTRITTQIWNVQTYLACSFPLAVAVLVWRRRHHSLYCLIFLSRCSQLYACSVRWILSLAVSPSPRVSSYWRENCISTDTEWNEFGSLWNARVHKRKKRKYKPNITAEITYRSTDLVCFCSSYYPVSWQSEALESLFSVLLGFKMSRLSEETRLSTVIVDGDPWRT